jgi:hypothetical protein
MKQQTVKKVPVPEICLTRSAKKAKFTTVASNYHISGINEILFTVVYIKTGMRYFTINQPLKAFKDTFERICYASISTSSQS